MNADAANEGTFPLLEVDHVAFGADGTTILAGVDLSIGHREILALLGANGTGKTTLARLIMGCSGYAPTSGAVRLRGRDLAALPMHERARLGVTMSWQEPARIEGLRVRDYLALGHAAIEPDEALRRVGLSPDAYVDRMLDKTLSSGERKRIELASVLAMQPALAILDEPAAGIDLASVDEIAQVIRDLREAGGSVLLITHVDSIAQVADRAAYLCGGRIVFSGDVREVVARYRARRCVVCDGETCQ